MAEYVDLISMSLADPNLKPVEGGFQSIEPGTYVFEIEKQTVAPSSKGDNQLRVTGRVVGPEDSPMHGKTMMNFYAIKPDDEFSRGRMLQLLTAAGAAIDGEGRFSREALVGLQFVADVEKRAGTKVDKLGKETTTEFTSWLRERSLDAGTDVVAAAPAASKPATTNGNAARRPAPPAGGNGTAQRRA